MPKVTFTRDRVQPSTQMGQLAMKGDVVEVPKKEADLYVERGWATIVASAKAGDASNPEADQQ